jgi:hypothetical protein
MLIRMVEVVEVKSAGEPLDMGFHTKVRLQSPTSEGRNVWLEIDQPLNDAVHFEPREEMVMVLVPAKSLLAHVAKALGEHNDGPG